MSKPLHHQYPLVMVQWADAMGGHRQGWRSLSSITPEVSMVTTIGFLLWETESILCVCPNIATAEGVEPDADGEMNIPVNWVREIRYLGLKRKRKRKD